MNSPTAHAYTKSADQATFGIDALLSFGGWQSLWGATEQVNTLRMVSCWTRIDYPIVQTPCHALYPSNGHKYLVRDNTREIAVTRITGQGQEMHPVSQGRWDCLSIWMLLGLVYIDIVKPVWTSITVIVKSRPQTWVVRSPLPPSLQCYKGSSVVIKGSMSTHTYPYRLMRKIKVANCNRQVVSQLYLWPDVYSSDMQAKKSNHASLQ